MTSLKETGAPLPRARLSRLPAACIRFPSQSHHFLLHFYLQPFSTVSILLLSPIFAESLVSLDTRFPFSFVTLQEPKPSPHAWNAPLIRQPISSLELQPLISSRCRTALVRQLNRCALVYTLTALQNCHQTTARDVRPRIARRRVSRSPKVLCAKARSSRFKNIRHSSTGTGKITLPD